jgi:hypothetical protein
MALWRSPMIFIHVRHAQDHNAELAKRGFKASLTKGDGYFYFQRSQMKRSRGAGSVMGRETMKCRECGFALIAVPWR